jgi:YD repeat-containing protein
VAEGLEAVEREEAAHERELEEPGAVRERKLSADAYEDATASESQQLLSATFQAGLERLNSDPARALADLRLIDVFDGTVATVRGPGDDGSLLEAGIPIRVKNEEGDLEKVKLGLVEGDEGFEAENPLTEILIPPAADEQFSIGTEGLGLAVQGGEATAGRPFGEMNVYYPEVQKDTDLLVAPVTGGLEFFDQLRSSESPEALHFHLKLPGAASLRAIPAGGAMVEEGGETLAVVPPPVAIDAQGTSVPLELEVEGSDLTLRVPHRSGDYAYPILVDPAIEENYNSAWYSSTNFSSLNVWQYSTNDPTETYILHNTYCLNSALCSPSGRGLFISSMNRNIPANTYGQWYYYAPGGSNTYIPSIYPTASAYLNPFWRDNGNNCGWESYPQPHDYDGAFDAAGNWQWLETDRAQWYGNASMFTKANGIAIGLSTGNSSVNIPCWRNIMLGGFVVRLDDSDNPSLSSVTGFPSGWTGAGAAVNVTANISDGGLGVRNVKVYPSGMPGIPYISEASECPGTKTNPCPASRAAQFSLKAESFDEGEKQVQVSGWDPTGKVSNTYTAMLRIDRQPPEITIGGQLGKATKETGGDAKDPTKWDELSLPVYNLELVTTDGSTASAEKKRSGVKSIEIFLDGETTPKQTWTQECPASSCSMTRNYALQLAALSPGKHVLKVVAKDQLNQPRAREIGFEFVPATGIEDDYVMQHFPLPDGKDHSAETTYGGPELAVNIANGNLVFREEDVDVEGPNVDLELERVYNSLLPAEDNTEWGDGWTLAETPQLEPVDTGGSSAPDLAKMVDESGGLKGQVAVPDATGAGQFDPDLQATLKKTASGFELKDETGEDEDTIEFNSAGRAEGVDAAGEAAIDFDYAGSAISDIAVEDPTSSFKSPPVPESLAPLPPPPPYFDSAFGSVGTAPGQMRKPSDVLADAEGNVWVLDRLNSRVERFNAGGEFVSAFGAAGSGDGQLSLPNAMDMDAAGNIWVLDTGNSRVEKFSKQGAFLGKFPVSGSGQGFLTGLAVDAKGNILVSSWWTGGMVQKFSPSGQSLGLLAPSGTGSGQISEPTSIAVAPNGNVWIVDANNRIQVFGESGSFIRQFGSPGSGDGQLSLPVAVEVDEVGHVWVLEQKNARVQEFTEGGRFLARFGSEGTGVGQFSLSNPAGITTDNEGHLWVTDVSNNRVQRWSALSYVLHEEVLPSEPANDPAVHISATNGLITSATGAGAGTNTYSYSGDDLIANKGPDGETKFTYDAGGRMTKVVLPNGTVATVAYDATYHRVISLTVDPAGEQPAKTTTFSYTNEPRKTVVTPADAPATTYEFAFDDSVFKWWNIVNGGPELSLAGTLWVNQRTELTVGLHNLEIQADAVEGVSSIQVIVNGDTVVQERTCDQDPATPGVDCLHQVDEWVIETGSLAPGVMNVQVQATDRIGNISTRSFWANVPYTPPPDPEAPLRPTFSETKRFREDYGLDRDLNPVTDQQELNNRIYDLLGAWGNPQTPEGEVARASAEKWGVPLRPVDVAEMEYREWYMGVNLPLIEDWAETHRTNTYAGYFVDHKNGGPIRVGFTADQSAAVAELKQQVALVAIDRITPQGTPPTSSRASLETTLASVEAQRGGDSALASVMLSIGVDEKSDAVEVTGTDVTLIEEHLRAALGSSAPIKVVYEPAGEEFAGRNHTDGRIRAGDRLIGYDGEYHECTGGFGAWDRIGTKPNGEPEIAPFALTAGHCAPLGRLFYRQDQGGAIQPKELQKVGHSGRTGQPGGQEFETDASAILLRSGNLMPYYMFVNGINPKPVGPAYAPRVGETLCFSGMKTNERKCGEFVGVRRRWKKPGQTKEKHLYLITRFAGIPGDSGAPVWSPRTGGSVGLLSGGPRKAGLYKDWITPLVVPRRQDPAKVPGILDAPGMGSLHLAVPGE